MAVPGRALQVRPGRDRQAITAFTVGASLPAGEGPILLCRVGELPFQKQASGVAFRTNTNTPPLRHHAAESEVMARRIATDDLHSIAAKLPDVEEGVACAGTSLEKRTMKVRGKAFLFLGESVNE